MHFFPVLARSAKAPLSATLEAESEIFSFSEVVEFPIRITSCRKPIVHEEGMIGAIGVSALRSPQDEQIVNADANRLGIIRQK
jgi:uncharacterized protein GlcG (DUF336 family)